MARANRQTHVRNSRDARHSPGSWIVKSLGQRVLLLNGGECAESAPEGVMEVKSLLRKLIAQNDIIIQQNEKLFLLVAQRANSQDAELLVEMRNLNLRLAGGSLPALKTSHT